MFSPPVTNGAGEGDWVLLLEAESAAPGPASPTFIQRSWTSYQSPQTTGLVCCLVPQTAGNVNVAVVGWKDTKASIRAVVDTSGNSYQVAVPTFRGSGMSQALYYASGIREGDNTVMVTFDRPASFVDIRVAEYAGLASVSTFQAGVSSSGSGSIADSGSVGNVLSNALIVGAGMTSASFSGPGPDFIQRVITSPGGNILEDRVAGSAGSYRGVASLDPGSWLMQVAVFRSAANLAPLATPDFVERWPNTGTKVAISTLLTNDIDPEGGPISFLAASPQSTNGGAILRSGDWLFYEPLPGFTNLDAFAYTIADARGATAAGLVLIRLSDADPPQPLLEITNIQSDSFTIQFEGVPSGTYGLEYSDDLRSPVWQPFGPPKADPFGHLEFAVTMSGLTARRFYRAILEP
jgi:hypothetical protein